MTRTIQLPHPEEPWEDATDRAQRFLDSARVSVENALNAMDAVRELRRQEEEKQNVGQLADSDMDQLRSAIVFAGAGLDATLKQLVRDALPDVLEINARAAEKFRSFVDKTLAPGSEGGGAGHRTLVNILLSDAESPREALTELYIGELCGSSLQSAEELDNVLGALGVEDQDVRKQVADAKGATQKAWATPLKQAFHARNQIVHELDLQVPEEVGQRTRRPRQIKLTMQWVTEVLAVAQHAINGVSKQLDEEYERG